MTKNPKNTYPVSDAIFREVYDAPAALPGRFEWVTSDEDVRQIDSLLGMPPKTIGAPPWVSGDRKRCPHCGREFNWLDIVSSALDKVHGREMIARVILGDQKFVNTEAPRAIEGLKCFNCQTPIEVLRSFKCHNWAYAKPALLKVVEQMKATRKINNDGLSINCFRFGTSQQEVAMKLQGRELYRIKRRRRRLIAKRIDAAGLRDRRAEK
jgi:hypothetical protein